MQGPIGVAVAVGGAAVPDGVADPVAGRAAVPVGVGEPALVASGDTAGVAVVVSAGVVATTSAGFTPDTPRSVGWAGADGEVDVAVGATG